METTIKEIAGLLRSTEEMATQFFERVQSRIGQPVSHAEVLAAMQDISAKSLTMDKVVAKLQQRRKAASRRATRRQSARQASKSTPNLGTEVESEAGSTDSESTSVDSVKQTKTILEGLGSVLQENWDRAEAEGLQPNRMSTEAFVNAVYQYTDRREGTRRRIMQAASQLDESDVLLTPALVADIVHELFEG